MVLGCTHYPLLIEDIEKVAPWPVSYIDPAPAIARRVADVLDETPLHEAQGPLPGHGTVILTSARDQAPEPLAAYASMGFPLHELLDLPV